jgi:hypothetical protein
MPPAAAGSEKGGGGNKISVRIKGNSNGGGDKKDGEAKQNVAGRGQDRWRPAAAATVKKLFLYYITRLSTHTQKYQHITYTHKPRAQEQTQHTVHKNQGHSTLYTQTKRMTANTTRPRSYAHTQQNLMRFERKIFDTASSLIGIILLNTYTNKR